MLFDLIPFLVLQPHVYRVLITQMFYLYLLLNVIQVVYFLINVVIILYLTLVCLLMATVIRFKLDLRHYFSLVQNQMKHQHLNNTFYA